MWQIFQWEPYQLDYDTNPATELATWLSNLLWKAGNYAVVYSAKCT